MNTSADIICDLERCGPDAKYVCLDNWDPNDPQAGTKMDCYNRIPTQNECANSFDLSNCAQNIDCKVGCNPHSNPPGLCPDLSPCPDTGCCDPRPTPAPSCTERCYPHISVCTGGKPCPETGCCDDVPKPTPGPKPRPGPRPGPRPDPTLKECVDVLSCDTDPFTANPNNYICDLESVNDGTCNMNQHCQSIVNNMWPVNPIGVGYYPEFSPVDDHPVCPKVSNVWTDNYWDLFYRTYNNKAKVEYDEEIPSEYCQKASPNGWWQNPRCQIQHGDFSGSIGACSFDAFNDPRGENSKCLPVINSCATCNHELADVCKKKFPFQIGRGCN